MDETQYLELYRRSLGDLEAFWREQSNRYLDWFTPAEKIRSGGFTAESLKSRILDADCSMVITANEGTRGNKIIPLKKNVDVALEDCPGVKKVIVVKRTENKVSFVNERDVWYHDATSSMASECQP